MATDPTKDKTQQAIADAEAEAAAKKAARDAANAEETAALQALQAKELEGLQQHNAAQYSNLGQIVGDIQSKIDVAKAKDETAQKRENAYRYISGLGDTLSSLANLVGVANKASNQQQTYNSHAVVQKAEEARKARKIEMDDLSKRLDEMTARQKDLKAAGSLAEAQMAVQHKKEQMTLKNQQEKEAREAEYKDRALMIDQMNAQANLKRAEASETNAETKANKPTSTSKAKPKVVVAIGKDGKMTEYDVSKYKNFDKDYQKALDAAIADGTSGLSETEIKDYQTAVKLAKADSGKALNEFLRTHTYRQSVIDRMKKGAGANDPEFE